MDNHRNWILIDSSIPRSPNGNRKRVVEVYATPSYDYPSTSSHSSLHYSRRDPSESKIHSLNRLNDRIHTKIAANSFLYSSTSSRIKEEEEEEVEEGRDYRRGEGERIVDHEFSFINNHTPIYESSGHTLSPSLNRLVQHRDSQGEIDAVYERKQPQPERGPSIVADTVVTPSSQWNRSISRPLHPSQSTPSKQSDRPDINRDLSSQHNGISHKIPITLTKERLRRDSTPLYSSCHICSSTLLQSGQICPICGTVETPPLRRLGHNYEYFPPQSDVPPPPRYSRSHTAPNYVHQSQITVEPYYRRREEILNPRTLKTLNRESNYWTAKTPVHSTVLKHSNVPDYSYRTYANTSDWRRKTRSGWGGDIDYQQGHYIDPGYTMRRAYYKYGKKRRSRSHTQRKALALALALLALALVISAGIVLAAINY